MSKFIDILNKSSQAAPQPMGFRTSQTAQPGHRLQLVASVAKAAAGDVTGANAGLLRIPSPVPSITTLKKAIPTVPDIPWGAWLEEASQDEVKKVTKSGCDFVIFSTGSALALPPDDNVGIIIQIDTAIAEGPLRALNELPIDAVLVTPQSETGSQLTWGQLMLLQRFGDIVNVPLLVSIPSTSGTDELQLLQDTGIDGVVVDIGSDVPSGEVNRLRQVIDSLKPPTTRKHQELDALVPRTGRDAEMMAEVEEDDEDD